MSQEPAMFDQPSPDALDALITVRLGGAPLPAGVADHPDNALALALLDAVEQEPLDATFSADLEERLRAAWRPQPATHRLRIVSPLPSLAPGLTSRLASRPRAIAAAILLILALLSALLAVPQARAAIAALLHIGSVTIVPTTPTPGANEPAPLVSVLDLAGQTTLADAQRQAPFPIRLPGYPTDLGAPQYVFAQDLGGEAIVLVWLEPGSPNHVRMSLSELSSNIYLQKFAPPVLQETTVHGQRAIWTGGPYIVVTKDGQYVQRRLITGHVLIWAEGGVTCRLETSLSLPEAVRVAESLR
jgi:hypothetical protein